MHHVYLRFDIIFQLIPLLLHHFDDVEFVNVVNLR